jgi:hypothetical protein
VKTASFIFVIILSAILGLVAYLKIDEWTRKHFEPTPVSICEDPEVKAMFNEIAERPYDVLNYNCKNKSIDFAKFLVEKGGCQVFLFTIDHQSGTYAHMMVQCDGLIYDPTMVPPVYGMDPEEYFEMIAEAGFTGWIHGRLFMKGDE